MREYKAKLQYVAPVYLLLSVLCVALPILFRWLGEAYWPFEPVDREVWSVWVPLLAPWLPMALWLSPRLNILAFGRREILLRNSFTALAALPAVAEGIFIQDYFSKKAGDVVRAPTPAAAAQAPAARFYLLGDYAMDDRREGMNLELSSAAENPDSLVISLFFVRPLREPGEAPKPNAPPRCWQAVLFRKSMSDELSKAEKRRRNELFYDESQQELARFGPHTTQYFERASEPRKIEDLREAVADWLGSEPPPGLLLLQPRLGAFADRGGPGLTLGLLALAGGGALWLLLLAAPGFRTPEEIRRLEAEAAGDDFPGDLLVFVTYLFPQGPIIAGPLLALANIVVFALMVWEGGDPLDFSGEQLVAWGANLRELSLDDRQYWRAIASMFVHGGATHLIYNLTGLALGAFVLEPALRPWRFLALYLVSGVAASWTSVLFNESAISVGASGGIYGIFGGVLALLLTDAYPRRDRPGLFYIFGAYALSGFVLTFGRQIDNAAHLGGLLAGAAAGAILYLAKPRPIRKKSI